MVGFATLHPPYCFKKTVLSKGFPKEADFIALDKLAEAIAQKHKEHGFR